MDKRIEKFLSRSNKKSSMAKKKYYAIKSICVDGEEYNSGDIVWSDYDLPGLVRAEKEEEPKAIIKKLAASEFFCAPDPEVSVIITFHNQERFVFECLDGFRRQSATFPYEVIAVIDKSDQNEKELIEQEFPGVRIEEVDFGNANKARNFGRKLASGDFIAYFDGDDFPFGDYLEKLRRALDNQVYDFSYARFEHDRFGMEKGKLPRCNIFEWSKSWNEISPITNTPIMIRKNMDVGWGEDFEIMQDMERGIKMGRMELEGVHVRERLWHYRTHEGSTWAINWREKRAKAEMDLWERYGWDGNVKSQVTFVSLISRDVVLDEYFQQIRHLGIPKGSHWLIIIDSDDEKFIDKVKRFQMRNEHIFRSSRMFVSGEKNLAYDKDFESRGMRVANFIRIIINQINEKIGGSDFVFMVEDDTRAPVKAFSKLWPMIEQDENIAYVSGIECGRGFTKHTGICNLIKDDKGEIIGRDIPVMQEKGIREIGGGGWYCWIGRSELLKEYIEKGLMRCFDG